MDEIPNMVLQKFIDLLSPYLLWEILKLEIYVEEWKEIVTCMIRKPSKPSYDVPKVYCPIALLNTMVKLLRAIVAVEISHITEKLSIFKRDELNTVHGLIKQSLYSKCWPLLVVMHKG